MNAPLVRWLFDIETIPEGAGGVHMVLEHVWSSWVWIVLVLGCAALAVSSYRRISGRLSGRCALAGLRFALLMLVLFLFAGPMLELPHEDLERDWVLLLTDRSRSMMIADVEEPGGRITRDEQLRGIVESASNTWRSLSERKHLHWLGFHGGAFGLGSTDDAESDDTTGSPPELGEPTGDRTDLDAALREVLERAAARPVSGIVVFSDGRTTGPPGRALRRRLQAEAIPVFVVPLGSAVPRGDIALGQVDAPRRAFVRDKVPVVVNVDRSAASAREIGCVVKLVDQFTGATLDSVELEPGDERDRVVLNAEPVLAGEAEWRVVIETDEPDLLPDNNTSTISIELVDRPLRVLLIDGYPRWEYRYLKNLLVREKTIECSVMLLSADRDFAQEGDQPITRLPRSREEMADYDVIVIGDAPAFYFSPDQIEMIRDHVANHGAGLLFIAGERYTPESYAGTPLADVLPMRGSLNLPRIGEAVNMQPTNLARRLGVLQMAGDDGADWPLELVDPSYGWSQLHYAQRIEPEKLKPTAEVVAETAQIIDGKHLPLVTDIRYGAGRSVYVATDEIWRWRYGRGELLPDQFWIQMIRMLGRERLTVARDGVVLDVQPKRIEINQAARIGLRLIDARLIESAPTVFIAVIENCAGDLVGEVELRASPSSEERFAGMWLPDSAGTFTVRIADPTLSGQGVSVTVEVHSPDEELRRPETDHELLERLALSTGGRMLDGESMSELLTLPNRAVRTLNPVRERIWDTPAAFTLVLLLLTLEWVGRKIMRYL